MKLASLKGGRDGRLVVVSDDLAWCVEAGSIAPTLQAALDAWTSVEPRLRDLADRLEAGRAERRPFAPARAAAPLPRAFQWADGSAYVNHVQLVRQARGAALPDSFWSDPLMYQGGSDRFLGPTEPIRLADERWGCDLEAEICVVTGDLSQGAGRQDALAAIRLVGLVNDVSLRHLIPAELAKGFGFVQSKPASALSAVLVTSDALGDAWHDGRLHGVLSVDVNGAPLGRPRTEVDMTFDFGVLVAHLARTRDIGAGSIIGSGTVSNRGAGGGPGRPVAAGGLGYSCLAEVRMVETILQGAPKTPFLRLGDRLRISFQDDAGRTPFGAIEQHVERL